MKSVALLLALACTLSVVAQDLEPVRKKHYNLADKKIALQGYDPVAYFTANKAIKGKEELSVSHAGVVYYFSSADHKELFKKNPARYEPEYGGWCAYAMGAKGEKVSIDPATFKIVDNKLYLFYNRFFNNTLKEWNKEEGSLKTKANQNWQQTIR